MKNSNIREIRRRNYDKIIIINRIKLKQISYQRKNLRFLAYLYM